MEARVFKGLDALEKLRKREKAFMSNADTWTIDTWDESGIALEIIIQILFMAPFSNTVPHQAAIIKSPSDIIMTAKIIEKYIFLRCSLYMEGARDTVQES